MEIFNLIKSSWVGIFEIFLMGISGYILVKKKILPFDASKVLSRLVMELALPLLIFSRMTTQFDFNRFAFWWVLPFVAIAMIYAGFLIGKFFSIGVDSSIKREFISLCAYQNSGYLPLALIASMFSANIADTLFIYTFLFLAGFNFLIWSIGTFYLRLNSPNPDTKFRWNALFTPPFIAVLVSLGLVAVGWNKFIPDVILNPVSQIGNCTVPLGIIAIGAILGEMKFKLSNFNMDLLKISFVKLLILPVITLIILYFVNLPKWMEFFIFLESLMPSATSLGIITRRYKTKYEFTANAIFITHVFSLISVPLLIALYYKFFI